MTHPRASEKLSISGVRHPEYQYDKTYWEVYRDTFIGGVYYRERYMQKFSEEETTIEFRRRKDLSPIPSFAKQALLEVRNSIFQRLPDVTRLGGSPEYAAAMIKDVDRKSTPMNHFVGINMLTEMLVIGKVGVYVDAPNVLPNNLAEGTATPYLYAYRAEDILSWVPETEENRGQFKAVLLRDNEVTYHQHFSSISLPDGRKERYRLVYRDEMDDTIRVKMFNVDDEVIFLPNSEADGSVILDIPYVPFVVADIGDSLLKDVWSYQVSLLNIMSGCVSFDISSNIPYLTIQDDLRTVGNHLKKPEADVSGEANSQIATEGVEKIGTTRGRYYDKNMDRPGFISPSSEPLMASMQLQEKLQDDIRKLVHLAVEGKAGSRTESAEAKKIAAQSFEAGLAQIGTVLQTAEAQIAEIWAHYEDTVNPQVAKVAYPSQYSIKTEAERLEEAEALMEIADKAPSKAAKKETYKRVLALLLEDKVKPEIMEQVFREVDSAKYTRTDVDFILECRKEGMVSDETASEALGFASGEVEKAADDHAERLLRIVISQTEGAAAAAPVNPASRGNPDADPNIDSGREEQAEGRENSENSE